MLTRRHRARLEEFDNAEKGVPDYPAGELGDAIDAAPAPSDGAGAAGSGGGAFDPAEHSVDDVNAYLADADEAEAARVRAAEETGKARKGILGG